MNQANPRNYIYVSILAALATMALKGYAWFVSNSVAVLTDAGEASINLLAAIFALTMLRLASRPPDETHDFGHAKAEYFSTGVEGFLIVVAGLGIGYASIHRVFNPEPFAELSLGLWFVFASGLVNLLTVLWLRSGFQKTGSVVLKADADHLMVDVWTTVLLIIGLTIAQFGNMLWIDATLGVLFSTYIFYNGFVLIKSSATSLMDSALSKEELEKINSILEKYAKTYSIQFHALRTRCSADRNYVSMHVLVPGKWTVDKGHDILESIEEEIVQIIPNTSVFTHLEPINDPSSFYDIELDRTEFKRIE